MTFFITFLRAVATCLITNSHYTGVYPTDLIANGGLIGDVIFFAVSGYCLYSVKGNFLKWYGKRIWRCYLPVLIITGIFMLLGAYTTQTHNAFWWFVYPTYYHFVASIVLLYIPYYIVMKIDFLKRKIPFIMLAIAIVYLAIYICAYDKSYYHIDNVRQPMIRFLFMESMLLGAYFRQNDERYKNRFSWWMPICLVISFVLYFASKLVFSSKESLAVLQIVNQILIFVLLYFVMRTFCAIDSKLESIPKWIKAVVAFLAAQTLEIYVVQYVIIDKLKGVLPFPLNWLLLTFTIILSAFVLHVVCNLITRFFEWAITTVAKRIKEKRGA